MCMGFRAPTLTRHQVDVEATSERDKRDREVGLVQVLSTAILHSARRDGISGPVRGVMHGIDLVQVDAVFDSPRLTARCRDRTPINVAECIDD